MKFFEKNFFFHIGNITEVISHSCCSKDSLSSNSLISDFFGFLWLKERSSRIEKSSGKKNRKNLNTSCKSQEILMLIVVLIGALYLFIFEITYPGNVAHCNILLRIILLYEGAEILVWFVFWNHTYGLKINLICGLLYKLYLLVRYCQLFDGKLLMSSKVPIFGISSCMIKKFNYNYIG